MERTAQLVRSSTSCPRCGLAVEPEAGQLNFCPGCGLDLRASSPPARPAAALAPGREPPAADEERSSTTAWVGQVVADRYRLIALLGEGGMGQVFKAEHARMGKALALKLLRGRFARDAAAVARFKAEAQIVSRLSHPHTIAVFDFGELGSEGFYLAMEYVRGKDLATLLREQGRLPEARAAEIGAQVLGSLAEAHAAGVVHRDVKPANIMVTESAEGDFVKVLDFGVAKLRGAAAETAHGAVLGTPSYLAPEQARAQELDGRADLYALGAVLYELVSGRPPFTGANPLAVIAAHVHGKPRPLGEVAPVSAAFAEVVHRALAKRPGDRFPGAGAMREALLASRAAPEPAGPLASGPAPAPAPEPEPEAASGQEREPPPPSLEIASRSDFAQLERELRAVRRGRAGAPALALALVALLAAGGVAAWRWSAVYPALARWAPRAVAMLPAEARPADLWDGQEHEPNDTPSRANFLPIPPGPDGRPAGGEVAVWGYIGARHDAATGDVDVYRIEVPVGPRPVELQAEWSSAADPAQGIRGLDVALTLNHRGGGDPAHPAPLVARAFRGGPGRPRRLTALVAPGTYWLAVRERHEPSGEPVERPSDPYLLRVRLAEPRAGVEVEPNDAPEAGPQSARYAGWRALAARNPVGEGAPVVGETAPDDPDTYALRPAGPAERPLLALLVPAPRLALTAQLWTPDAEDRAARGGAERVRFAEAAEGEPGEVLAVPLAAPPTIEAPALLRLRAAAGDGRYEVLLVGAGRASGPALLARMEALAAEGRAAQALELVAAFARALPAAPARDEVLAAGGRLAERLAAHMRPGAVADHARAARLTGHALFEVVEGRVRYGGAFELLVTGTTPLAEEARLRALSRALPCTPDEVAERARAFLARFPGSAGEGVARLSLARAEEDAYFDTGSRSALVQALVSYRALALGRGPGAREALERVRALSRPRPEAPAVPRTRCAD